MKHVALILSLLATCAWADPAAWKVSGIAGGELWLLGSMHYLRDEDYPLPSLVNELYERAETVVMELDLDDLDAVAAQAAFLEAGALPPTTSLSAVLDPGVYSLAQTRARTLGVELQFFDRFEPWLVALTLMDLGMSRLGFHANRGLEQYFLEQVRRDGKELLGLESLESQIRVFDDLSRRDQEALLVQTLQELDAPEAGMQTLLAAWREGSLEELFEELMADFEDFPDLYEALVTRRNEVWVHELTALLDQNKRCLVVVGALHLVGDDSVVEMLRARGLRVQPL